MLGLVGKASQIRRSPWHPAEPARSRLVREPSESAGRDEPPTPAPEGPAGGRRARSNVPGETEKPVTSGGAGRFPACRENRRNPTGRAGPVPPAPEGLAGGGKLVVKALADPEEPVKSGSFPARSRAVRNPRQR